MATKAGTGMKQKADRKTRGLTSISANVAGSSAPSPKGPRASKSDVSEALRADATRPISSGVSHRGDRRDTSKTYTGNARHSSRGNNPRVDVKTRKR